MSKSYRRCTLLYNVPNRSPGGCWAFDTIHSDYPPANTAPPKRPAACPSGCITAAIRLGGDKHPLGPNACARKQPGWRSLKSRTSHNVTATSAFHDVHVFGCFGSGTSHSHIRYAQLSSQFGLVYVNKNFNTKYKGAIK